MKSVELTIKLRNNLLKERRKSLGFTTKQMAEAIGVGYYCYIEYENMRVSPIGMRFGRHWKRSAMKIADYHCCQPEALWPDALLAITQPEVATKIDAEEVAMIAKLAASAEPALLPELALDVQKRAEAVSAALTGLTNVEQHVLRRRFGLDGEEPETLAVIGARLGLSKERVRIIEAHSLRMIRSSKRKVRSLAEFVEDESVLDRIRRIERRDESEIEQRLYELAGVTRP